MEMARIAVRGWAITDWASFHDEFSRAFCFFDGYGHNKDAWLDCMTDLHGADSLSGLDLSPEEPVEIELLDSDAFKRNHPKIFSELLMLVAHANKRYVEMNQPVRITLIEA